ncbi:MAG TPA: hypothetical protein VM933_08595 [Acidimicrobiales bacterium]|nr:hypothetical protein [Acidimicrobiales bacterium]
MDDEARRRYRQAIEIHDDVVQGLATAKLAIELGDREGGVAALEETLRAARRIVTDLLSGAAAGEVVDLTDGLLRRDSPAGLG